MIGGALAYRCYESRSSIIKRAESQRAKLAKEFGDFKHEAEFKIETLQEDVNELKSKNKEFKIKVDTLQEERARLTSELDRLRTD